MNESELLSDMCRMKENIHTVIEKLELVKKHYLYYRNYLFAVDRALHSVLVEKNHLKEVQSIEKEKL